MNRKKMAKEIKDTFETFDILTVHWDGKMCANIRNWSKEERLAVAVSSSTGTPKLLGIPHIVNSTGISRILFIH